MKREGLREAGEKDDVGDGRRKRDKHREENAGRSQERESKKERIKRNGGEHTERRGDPAVVSTDRGKRRGRVVVCHCIRENSIPCNADVRDTVPPRPGPGVPGAACRHFSARFLVTQMWAASCRALLLRTCSALHR